jgi:chromosome segregation ATPase
MESLQLRASALEAELQQERDNTKILQQDRIAVHQLKRELEDARAMNRTVLLEKQQLQDEIRQLQLREANTPRGQDTTQRQQASIDMSSQLYQLERDLAAAQTSMATTERELESVRSDRDGLKSIVSDLEKQLEERKSVSHAVLETLRNELKVAREECSKQEHALETLTAEKDLVESLIPGMHRELDQSRASARKSQEESSRMLYLVQDHLSSTQQELSSATLKNEHLEAQVTELTQVLHATNMEAKDLQKQLEKLTSDNNAHTSDRAENDKLRFQLTDVTRSLDVMKERLKQQETLHDLEIEKLQLDNESLIAQVQDLKTSFQQRSAEESAVSYFQLQDKEAVLEVQREKLTDQETTIKNLKHQLDAKTLELVAVKKLVDELRISNESSQVDVNRLTSMVDDMGKTQTELEGKLAAAKEQLGLAKEDCRLRIKSLESENNRLEERLGHMRQDLRNEKSRTLALEKSKSHVDNELAVHENRSFALLKMRNDEVDELNSKLLLSKRQLEDMTTQLGEVEWLYEKAQRTCSDTEDKLAKVTDEVRKLRRELQSLESSKRHQQSLVDSLSAAKITLSSEVTELQHALAERDEKLSNASVLYQTTLASLDDFRTELTHKANELVASQSDVARLEDECSQLSRRIAEVMGEKSLTEDAHSSTLLSLHGEIAEGKAKRNELESLLNSVRRSATESEERSSRLQDLLDREHKNYHDFRLESNALRKDLEEQLEVATSHIKDLEAAIVKRDRDINSLQRYSTKSDKELLVTKKELATLHERFELSRAELVHENEELLSSLSVLRTRNEELSSQLSLASARQAEQQQDSATTIRSLEEKLRITVTETESKTRVQEELLKARELEFLSLRAHRDELNSAKSEIVRLTALLRRTKDESENLSRTNDELRQHQVDKTNQLITNYRRDFERLEKEKIEVEHLLRKSEERREAAEDRLYSSEEGLLAAQSERERLILEKNSLLSDLENAKEMVESLQLELHAQQDTSRCSNDGICHEFGGLSKSELCSKCDELQTEVRSLRTQAESLARQELMRSGQLAQVEEDNDLLQAEIDKLIQSNTALKSRLQESMALRTEAMKTEAVCQSKLSDKEEQVRRLEQSLEETSKKNAASMEKIARLETERLTAAKRADSEMAGLKKTILDLEHQARSAASDKRLAEDELGRKGAELLTLRLETKALRDQVSTLESQISDTKDQLQSAKQMCDVLRVEKDGEVSRHSIQTKILENERSALRLKVSQLEEALDTAQLEIQDHLENESRLRESLEKQRVELTEKEESRGDAVDKLAEATSLISSQKDSIAILERRASAAENTAASLTIQVSHLSDTLKKLEESRESKAGLRESLIKDLEDRRLHLEKERDEANAATSTLREELRQLRRNLGETERLNTSLKERAESFKASRDKAKSEVEEARSALEESKFNARRLQEQVEAKRLENDRLRANVKLLDATVSRVNSDLLLYKEAALQAEFRLAQSSGANEDKSRLEAELVRKTSKLEHLSEVFRSQQKVLSLSQNLEEQLITFIEGVIQQVDEAFDITSSTTPGVDAVSTQLERKLDLRGLDLAGLERSTAELSRSRLSLWHLVQNVLMALEDKRRQLCDWKKQRSQRILSIMTTPESKARSSIPETPVVMETLHNVKRVLNEHLSPLKENTVGRLDVEYFQKVIHSLEHHIDILLDDLQSARDALSTKQQLFVDLEQVASHHEWEKSRLEKQLQKQKAEVHQLQDTLQHQSALTSKAEQELDGVRSQLRVLQESHHQIAVSSFEGEEMQPHGDAMLPTTDSELHQRQVALQLTHHLDESRLKLAKLKQQRRRRSTEPSLDRIVEGYETT